MSVLVARDVWVAPPGCEPCAVRGASLAVGRGEWLAITGPNGCGKTSLALALAGLWPIRRGALALEGRPFDPRARRLSPGAVAAVLQEPASQLLQPTVAEELAFSALNLGHAEAEVGRRVARWSRALGLDGDLGRDPRALSAGRQQVALLAAALVARPRVLVVDEGGAHLDPEARRMVLAAVRAEVAAGLAVVWVTQEPGELAAADRVLELGADGRPPRDPAPGQGEARPAEAGPEPPPLARVEVAAWAGEEGPCVRTARALTLTIRGRGVTALAGRNGAGKSVLLEAIAGAGLPDQVVVAWSRPPRPAPLLAAQHPEHQICEERVADELAYAAVRRGVERDEALARAVRQSHELGLGDSFLDRRTWDLSAGEKRLTQLVATLIAPAAVVLLDEPTGGLDPDRRAALARLVARRAEESPILVASQDLPWVRGLGAQVVTLAG